MLSSAFPAIVVYAQGLTPGNVGAVAGLFFVQPSAASARRGSAWSPTIRAFKFVYQICSFLPAIGIIAAFLPNPRPAAEPARG